MRTSFAAGALFVAATTTVALLAVPGASAAATHHPVYYRGTSGGSTVRGADGSAANGPTAQSILMGITLPKHKHNKAAAAAPSDGLFTSGAVVTDETAQALGEGTELVSRSKTQGLNILGGTLRASAVVTTAKAAFDGDTLTTAGFTSIKGLKIAGVTVPTRIPRNYKVTVPGVADITLNSATTHANAGTVSITAAGIYVETLAQSGTMPAGTKITINPTYASFRARTPDSPIALAGIAYGSSSTTSGDGTARTGSGRTSYQSLPPGGTHGRTVTNSTGGVDVPDAFSTGQIQTTIKGVRSMTTGDIRNTASTSGFNLMGGMITAKDVKSAVHLHVNSDGTIAVDKLVHFDGLMLGGTRIPNAVPPNTTRHVAGVGTVVLNQQDGNDFSATVHAIHIEFGSNQDAVPAGTVIDIAVVSGYILS